MINNKATHIFIIFSLYDCYLMDFITAFVKTWSCCQNFVLHPDIHDNSRVCMDLHDCSRENVQKIQIIMTLYHFIGAKNILFSLDISFYYYWTIVVCFNKLHDYYRVRMNLYIIIVHICKMFQLLWDPSILSVQEKYFLKKKYVIWLFIVMYFYNLHNCHHVCMTFVMYV